MVRLTKEQKASVIIRDEKIFVSYETDRIRLYVCKGLRNDVYEIIYDKVKSRWKCDCGNIKHTDCYHILAAKRLDEIENNTKNDWKVYKKTD